MITSLISAIVGLISGIVPDAIKEFTAGRAHTREVEFLKLQNEMAIQRSKTESEDKLREAHEGELAAGILQTIL